ncbi:hypothetical protein [Ferruginibacter sp.]|nr:hypothetical protein [Ferruginibacter sp.]
MKKRTKSHNDFDSFTHYPHVFFPLDYEKIIQFVPVLPSPPVIPLKHTEIQIPLKKSKIITKIIFFGAFFGTILLLVYGDEDKDFRGYSSVLWIMTFISFGLVGLYISYKSQEKYDDEIKNIKNRNNEECLNYDKKMSLYFKELNYYDNEIKKITSSENLFNIRYNKICNSISKLPQANYSTDKNTSLFYQTNQIFVDSFLAKSFLIDIYSDLATIYLKNKHQIAIDIKIDFPYSSIDTRTTKLRYYRHCISRGRIVLVFEDRQVKTQPKECIECIEYVIDSILHLRPIDISKNENLSLTKIPYIPNIPPKTNDDIYIVEDLPF